MNEAVRAIEAPPVELAGTSPMMERATLRAMLEGVILTAGKDETRPHLAGVFFRVEHKTLTLVSTDGHRLTRSVAAWESEQRGPWDMTDFLIPIDRARALLAMIKKPAISKHMRETVTLHLEGTGASAFFVAELVNKDELSCKPSGDANFPPFEKVIPAERTKGDDGTGCAVIGVEPKYLGDVAKAARHLASGGVQWSVAGDRDPVRIDLRNPDLGIESTIVIMPMRI